jgi:hypothetical protein
VRVDPARPILSDLLRSRCDCRNIPPCRTPDFPESLKVLLHQP